MSTKTKSRFDPSQVTSLLHRGTAEARNFGHPLVSIPTPISPTETAEPSAAPVAAGEPHTSESSTIAAPTEDGEPETATGTGQEKRAITIRLSDEVLSALYRHQAELRCTRSSRLRDTTIGGVIDTLLRVSLQLPPAAR